MGAAACYSQIPFLINAAALSSPRWLLWGGLLLFLTVAAYVGYKRAPTPVKMPIDMALRYADGHC